MKNCCGYARRREEGEGDRKVEHYDHQDRIGEGDSWQNCELADDGPAGVADIQGLGQDGGDDAVRRAGSGSATRGQGEEDVVDDRVPLREAKLVMRRRSFVEDMNV